MKEDTLKFCFLFTVPFYKGTSRLCQRKPQGLCSNLGVENIGSEGYAGFTQGIRFFAIANYCLKIKSAFPEKESIKQKHYRGLGRAAVFS